VYFVYFEESWQFQYPYIDTLNARASRIKFNLVRSRIIATRDERILLLSRLARCDSRMTIASLAAIANPLKKFLSRHRRRRQMTSTFIAEGDPKFPQLRASKFTRSDPAVCDSSSLLPPCHRMRDFFAVSPSCRAMHEQFDPLVFLVCLLADDFRSPTDSGVRTLPRTDPRAPHARCASNPVMSSPGTFRRLNLPLARLAPVEVVDVTSWPLRRSPSVGLQTSLFDYTRAIVSRLDMRVICLSRNESHEMKRAKHTYEVIRITFVIFFHYSF